MPVAGFAGYNLESLTRETLTSKRQRRLLQEKKAKSTKSDTFQLDLKVRLDAFGFVFPPACR